VKSGEAADGDKRRCVRLRGFLRDSEASLEGGGRVYGLIIKE